MKITDYILQSSIPEENKALRSGTADVNMRLYKTCEQYRGVIKGAVDYLEWYLKAVWEDHPYLRSISGAKIGIPWNIIVYKDQCSVSRVCLNPVLVSSSITTIKTQTKCASLSLTDQFEAERYMTIDLEWHDLNGHKVIQKNISRTEGGYAIQHELNHCHGACPDGKTLKDFAEAK